MLSENTILKTKPIYCRHFWHYPLIPVKKNLKSYFSFFCDQLACPEDPLDCRCVLIFVFLLPD